jgi:hypothetical protein
MSLPPTFRVKISSEDAGMAITPVVSRDMPLQELILCILGVTGKDPVRIREILERGSIVSGASRIRWTGVAAEQSTVRDLLAMFPNPDPSQPFEPVRCIEVMLAQGRRRISIDALAAQKRRWLRRESFWDVLLRAVPHPKYHDYSYKDSSDVYRAVLSPEQRVAVRDGLRLLTFTVRLPEVDTVEFYVPRK